MRFLAIILCITLLSSCDYFNIKEKEKGTSEIVAIVNTEKLFRSDLESFLPKKINKQDSIVLVKSYIQDWAIKQLLLKQAEKNSSLEEVNKIDNLVKDYKESLLINNYKEQLIKQKLDTIISEEEIEKYYNLNKENFKLNVELVKVKYLHFNRNIKDKKEIIDLFKSDNIEDLEELEKQELSFIFHQFNDSIWRQLDNILLKVPFSKEKLLKKTKLTQEQDSLGLYLVAIKDVLQRNSIAPLSYIKPTIKQMILHRRKIELIRDIEKIIVKDATQNNNFKIY
ncbi:hypothetical protein BTO04_04855 [Polaribacter sp. SA4-10]|uniref:hypothetical protein n=1 Tax=Polaribacter sp. SA4-10 TaxID=754397 RepID=UPI000B3D2607|nr:hypothetical protein [Polaribacter sp. SA4-10]ARV06072.1 hypothetical protein BTO04_04855 [Polaribacter sp. SA4-10]